MTPKAVIAPTTSPQAPAALAPEETTWTLTLDATDPTVAANARLRANSAQQVTADIDVGQSGQGTVGPNGSATLTASRLPGGVGGSWSCSARDSEEAPITATLVTNGPTTADLSGIVDAASVSCTFTIDLNPTWTLTYRAIGSAPSGEFTAVIGREFDNFDAEFIEPVTTTAKTMIMPHTATADFALDLNSELTLYHSGIQCRDETGASVSRFNLRPATAGGSVVCEVATATYPEVTYTELRTPEALALGLGANEYRVSAFSVIAGINPFTLNHGQSATVIHEDGRLYLSTTLQPGLRLTGFDCDVTGPSGTRTVSDLSTSVELGLDEVWDCTVTIDREPPPTVEVSLTRLSVFDPSAYDPFEIALVDADDKQLATGTITNLYDAVIFDLGAIGGSTFEPGEFSIEVVNPQGLDGSCPDWELFYGDSAYCALGLSQPLDGDGGLTVDLTATPNLTDEAFFYEIRWGDRLINTDGGMLGHGTSATFDTLSAGTYHVSFDWTSGYLLDSVSCVGATNDFDPLGATAGSASFTITLPDGADAKCAIGFVAPTESATLTFATFTNPAHHPNDVDYSLPFDALIAGDYNHYHYHGDESTVVVASGSPFALSGSAPAQLGTPDVNCFDTAVPATVISAVWPPTLNLDPGQDVRCELSFNADLSPDNHTFTLSHSFSHQSLFPGLDPASEFGTFQVDYTLTDPSGSVTSGTWSIAMGEQRVLTDLPAGSVLALSADEAGWDLRFTCTDPYQWVEGATHTTAIVGDRECTLERRGGLVALHQEFVPAQSTVTRTFTVTNALYPSSTFPLGHGDSQLLVISGQSATIEQIGNSPSTTSACSDGYSNQTAGGSIVVAQTSLDEGTQTVCTFTTPVVTRLPSLTLTNAIDVAGPATADGLLTSVTIDVGGGAVLRRLADGSIVGPLSHAGQVTVSVDPGSGYAVDIDCGGIISSTGTLSHDFGNDDVECVVTHRATSLTVAKRVTTSAIAPSTPFDFTVTPSITTGSISILDLEDDTVIVPVGQEITITEQTAVGYRTTSECIDPSKSVIASGSTTVNVNAAAGAVCTFVNTPEVTLAITGTIEITGPADPDLYSVDVNVTTPAGTTRASLANGDTMTPIVLGEGATVSIGSNEPGAWSVELECVGLPSASVNRPFVVDTDLTCNIAHSARSLEVSKVVTPAPATASTPFDFEVTNGIAPTTFELGHGETQIVVVAAALNPAIEETDTVGHEASWECVDTGTGAAIASAAGAVLNDVPTGDVRCVVTNRQPVNHPVSVTVDSSFDYLAVPVPTGLVPIGVEFSNALAGPTVIGPTLGTTAIAGSSLTMTPATGSERYRTELTCGSVTAIDAPLTVLVPAGGLDCSMRNIAGNVVVSLSSTGDAPMGASPWAFDISGVVGGDPQPQLVSGSFATVAVRADQDINISQTGADGATVTGRCSNPVGETTVSGTMFTVAVPGGSTTTCSLVNQYPTTSTSTTSTSSTSTSTTTSTTSTTTSTTTVPTNPAPTTAPTSVASTTTTIPVTTTGPSTTTVPPSGTASTTVVTQQQSSVTSTSAPADGADVTESTPTEPVPATTTPATADDQPTTTVPTLPSEPVIVTADTDDFAVEVGDAVLIDVLCDGETTVWVNGIERSALIEPAALGIGDHVLRVDCGDSTVVSATVIVFDQDTSPNSRNDLTMIVLFLMLVVGAFVFLPGAAQPVTSP